jgi:ribonuclease HI
MPYYAVAKGREIGIYTTWTECKEMINGYSRPIFKKFDTKNEAEIFIIHNSEEVKEVKPLKIKEIMTEKSNEEFIPDYYVYTDGACSNNGYASSVAGIGIYFGENDPRNLSMQIDGKQTNNTAELGAFLHLYKIIESDLSVGKKIVIMSDSQYAIHCATIYGKNQELNQWKINIPNKELVKVVYELYKNKSNVQFRYIKAHTDKKDIHSIGNQAADTLANKAIAFCHLLMVD